jgi:hypothetical protein
MPKQDDPIKGRTYKPVRSWKNVFNSDHVHYSTVDEVIEAARAAGYPYFSWGSDVFLTPESGTWTQPICKTHELASS